jgi:hypothetical protein
VAVLASTIADTAIVNHGRWSHGRGSGASCLRRGRHFEPEVPTASQGGVAQSSRIDGPPVEPDRGCPRQAFAKPVCMNLEALRPGETNRG